MVLIALLYFAMSRIFSQGWENIVKWIANIPGGADICYHFYADVYRRGKRSR